MAFVESGADVGVVGRTLAVSVKTYGDGELTGTFVSVTRMRTRSGSCDAGDVGQIAPLPSAAMHPPALFVGVGAAPSSTAKTELAKVRLDSIAPSTQVCRTTWCSAASKK